MADLEKKLIDKGLTLSPLAVSYVYTMYSIYMYMYMYKPTVPVLKAGHPGVLNILCRFVKFLFVLVWWFGYSGLLGCIGVLNVIHCVCE